MQTKLIEIRDKGTTILALAIQPGTPQIPAWEYALQDRAVLLSRAERLVKLLDLQAPAPVLYNETRLVAQAGKFVYPASVEAENWAWGRSGYGRTYEAQKQYLLLYPIDPDTGARGDGPLYDPYRWQNHRTMRTAHRWLIEHFDEIESGDVLDIEFILGETPEPKVSERLAGATQ